MKKGLWPFFICGHIYLSIILHIDSKQEGGVCKCITKKNC